MGKALIVSDQGKGEYTAQIIHDTERAALVVSSLGGVIADITTKLTTVNAELAAKQAEINAIQNELDSAINSGQEPEVLFEIVEKLAKPTAEAAKVRAKKNALLGEKLAAQKRIDFINANTPATENITMWCADYTEGLTGEVGTMEVNGTLKAAPIIFPNEIENSAYNQARDAQMQPIVSSGAPAVYFNRALLPGWQKWLPTYRVGTVTAKSGDTCSVTLDAAAGQQDLNINQTPTLTSVPIEYMKQNGLVFEVGDRVVVRFSDQDWTQPRVIGFESHPKPEDFIYLLNDPYFNGDSSQMHSHKPDGSIMDMISIGNLGGFAARNLVRAGGHLYFFYYEGNGNTTGKIKRIPTGGGFITDFASSVDWKFCANSTHVYYHEQDWNIYSRKIYKLDLTGAVVGSFNVTIPNVSVYEEMRPEWVDCNEQYFYWWMQDDYTLENPTTYICRSDLDGGNQEVVGTWPPPNMPNLTNGSSSWRGIHVTKDRIYIPWGRVSTDVPAEVVPIVCYVYDLDLNFITSFGGLNRGVGTSWLGGDYFRGAAANERMFVWLADNHAGSCVIQTWDRVLEYNGNGDLVSETYVQRLDSSNLRPTYTGILGGICL